LASLASQEVGVNVKILKFKYGGKSYSLKFTDEENATIGRLSASKDLHDLGIIEELFTYAMQDAGVPSNLIAQIKLPDV
jgi:hypothetical protein